VAAFGFESGDLFAAVQYTDPLDSNRRKQEFARLLLEGYFQVYAVAKGSSANYLIKGTDTTYYLYDDVVNYFNTAINQGLPNQLGNYRNALAFLARNCNNQTIDFAKVQFLDRDIIQAVRRINACYPGASVVHAQRATLKIKTVFYGGAFGVKNRWTQVSGGVELRLYDTKVSRKLSYVAGLRYAYTNTVSMVTSPYWRPYSVNEKTEVYSLPLTLHYSFSEGIVQPYINGGFSVAYKKINYNSGFPEDGFQRRYGVAVVGGVGVEVYPVSFLAIKADWHYELLLQYPTLGLAIRL